MNQTTNLQYSKNYLLSLHIVRTPTYQRIAINIFTVILSLMEFKGKELIRTKIVLDNKIIEQV